MTTLLTLFVSGDAPAGRSAFQELTCFVRDHLDQDVEAKVIDVAEAPELARDHRVLLTPLVVKDAPPAERRVFGDLDDTPGLVSGLFPSVKAEFLVRPEEFPP